MTSTTGIRPILGSSRQLITSLQLPNGAYPASPTFSAYQGYCWFRDGSFIADGMSAAGESGSASAFFDWCAMVIKKHESRITEIIAASESGTPAPDEKMLPARFTFDGELGTDDWWDFQLDGYGTWLWAAAEHGRRHAIDTAPWQRAAALTVDYLLSSWHRPCFDWWEEHSEQTHVSTLGCVAAGLRAAADAGLVSGARADSARRVAEEIVMRIRTAGVRDGHLTKWEGTSAVDASLSALIGPLTVIGASSSLARSTLDAIEQDLTVDDGVHRFAVDTFFGGGQWPLLSCFLGLAWVNVGDDVRARELLSWAARQANPDGDLPEQVAHHLLFPDREREWIDRWGPVATPLLWSHAMVLRLAAELNIDREGTST